MNTILETLHSSFNFGAEPSRMLRILMMHVNMLLFSLNDILDHKLIETNTFTAKTQKFNLQEVFKLIIDLVQ